MMGYVIISIHWRLLDLQYIMTTSVPKKIFNIIFNINVTMKNAYHITWIQSTVTITIFAVGFLYIDFEGWDLHLGAEFDLWMLRLSESRWYACGPTAHILTMIQLFGTCGVGCVFVQKWGIGGSGVKSCLAGNHGVNVTVMNRGKHAHVTLTNTSPSSWHILCSNLMLKYLHH